MKHAAIPLTGALYLAWVTSAWAAGGVVVTEFEGAKKKAVRDRIVKALEDAGTSVEDAAPDYAGPDGDYAAIAGEHEAVAVVSGETFMNKKGWRTQVVVRNGKDGETLEEFEVRGAWLPGLLKNIDKEVGGKVSSALERAEPAGKAPVGDGEGEEVELPEEEPEPTPADSEPERDEGAADDAGRKDRALSPLELGASFRVFSRDLEWNQDVNGNLRPYQLGAAPGAFVGGTWYPAAHFSRGAFANLGIVAEFEHGFATASELESGGGSYDTTQTGFAVGAKWRFPLGAHEVGISARYGRHEFAVNGDEDAEAVTAMGVPVQRDFVPDIAYSYLRPGLDARFTFGTFDLGVYAGYRHLLSMGDLQSDEWFPDASGTAMDAGIFAGYHVTSSLSTMVGFDFRRYGLDMNSKPEDLTNNRDVAGGAVDQYLTGWVGLGYRL